jgi:hypothetical protein
MVASADSGGERVAAIYSANGTVKLNDVTPKPGCVTY